MSRCERCGAKDHGTAGHDAAVADLAVDLTPSWRPRAEECTRQALLPFEPAYVSPDCSVLQAQPMKRFQPKGLMLWDVGTLSLSATIIGRDEQISASFRSVPARWFTVAQSFEQLEKAFREGIEPPAWGSWDVMYPGLICRLHFDAPLVLSGFHNVQAVMWGLTP